MARGLSKNSSDERRPAAVPNTSSAASHTSAVDTTSRVVSPPPLTTNAQASYRPLHSSGAVAPNVDFSTMQRLAVLAHMQRQRESASSQIYAPATSSNVQSHMQRQREAAFSHIHGAPLSNVQAHMQRQREAASRSTTLDAQSHKGRSKPLPVKFMDQPLRTFKITTQLTMLVKLPRCQD
jgi:hypothetical protein